MADRPYLFHELTNSLCNQCLVKVEAKVVIEGEHVFLLKRCRQHGFQKVLISTDADYYKLSRQTLKPGQMPARFNTPIKYGCPYDCGLCPDHEQHSCLTLVEITDQCNLTCPICYSESSPHRLSHRSLEQIEFMLDCVVRNEGSPDVVQISGGEPTIHPEFFEVLEMAKARPIRHLMVNTNGIRIANDADFARRLKEYMPGFEVYLQFDSLKAGPLRELRGADLSDIRRRALDRLNEHDISTTLVVTLKKGLNDQEIGPIIEYALKQPCVRGVTFQPVQAAGRLDAFRPGAGPAHAWRSAPADPSADECVWTLRRGSGAVSSGLPGDGVCAEDGGECDAVDGADRSEAPASRGGEHDHVRAKPVSARGAIQAVFDCCVTGGIGAVVAAIALLPAGGDGARRRDVQERVPGDHHAVPGCVQLRRSLGEKDMRAYRAHGWPDHSV